MKQRDHRALARFFIRRYRDRSCLKTPMKRWLFTVGNVIPDYLPLTYARGARRSHALKGHHCAYSAPHIRKKLAYFEKNGIGGAWDCFALGMLLHYVADAFTYAHTENFRGDLKQHRAYERRLHTYVCNRLENADPRCDLEADTSLELLFDRFSEAYRDCKTEESCAARDSGYILDVCEKIYCALCECAREEVTENT